MRRLTGLFLVAGLVWLAGTGGAQAYIGPGAGLTAIGTVFAVIGAVLLAIVGFLWYPIKRMLNKGKAKAAPATENPAPNSQTAEKVAEEDKPSS